MKHSSKNLPGQEFDLETGEIYDGTPHDPDDHGGTPHDDDGTGLFGGEGMQPDGTIILPKISMASIRAMPERCKMIDPPRPMKMALVIGIAGGEFLMAGIDGEQRLLDLGPDHPEYMTFSALVSALEPWGCVRFDDSGEPNAVFKSDYLFLPTDHNTVIKRRRHLGQVAIAYELWAQPANNPRGYSWYIVNLARYNSGISAVDRMLKLGVQTGRLIEHERGNIGILADLRNR